MRIRVLSVILCSCAVLLAAPWSAVAGGVKPSMIPHGLPALHAAGRAQSMRAGFAFAPLGVRLAGSPGLTGSATLTGKLTWRERAIPNGEAFWLVPNGAALAGASAPVAADGTFTMSAVPPASGSGRLGVTWGDSTWGPYTLMRYDTSWADGVTTTFDFTSRSISIDGYPGGPWDGGHRNADTYGHDAISPIAASSGIAHNGQTENHVQTLPGLVEQAAVYYYSNEGVEFATQIDTSDADSADYYTDASAGFSDVLALGPATAIALRPQAGLRRVYRTTDGGGTWSGQATGGVFDIDFADSLHGWAVGYAQASLLTTDGGENWTTMSPLGLRDCIGVSAADADHVWAVGVAGAIAASEDGGISWSTQTSGVSSRLAAVDFADALHGWAVGDGGVVLATTDGGASWSRQASGTTLGLQDVEFADTTHGYAVGAAYDPARNVVLSTSNGGATWVKRVTGTSQPLHDLCAITASTVWAVGDDSTIISSSDGGASWATHPSGRSSSGGYELYAIDLLPSGDGWAAGEHGTILRTSDGGTSWRRQLNLNTDQEDAQRFWIQAPYWASGAPGTKARLTLQQFGKGFRSQLVGYEGYPADAPVRSLGAHTSMGGRNESKTITIPKSAAPGYWYVVGLQNLDGVLYLETPFQVCTLKPSAASVRRGQTVRLSGVVPVQGHEGSKPGVRKQVALYQRASAAGQPTVWDATKKGWKRVGVVRTDGLGRYAIKAPKLSKATWFVVQYAGDKWYWGGYTSVVRVGVR